MKAMSYRQATKKAGWTNEDNWKSLLQGWGIFDADGSEDGRWQIQAIMAPEDNPDLGYDKPKFKDDRKAANFVKRQARKGDITAIRAIKFLKLVGSGDVKKFGLDDTPRVSR
jgi:hypothetical protein